MACSHVTSNPMVLLQLVGSFEGYCAPQFEQYFAFASRLCSATTAWRLLELRPFAFFLLTSVLLCTSFSLFLICVLLFLFAFSCFNLRLFLICVSFFLFAFSFLFVFESSGPPYNQIATFSVILPMKPIDRKNCFRHYTLFDSQI